MTVDDDNALNWTEQLPWELIAEFWTLSEILDARQVCHFLAEAILELSPQKCGSILEETLMQRNHHFLPYGSWTKAVQDQDSVSQMLIRYARGETHAFDAMLRCFRVFKYIPQEVAVAYSGKYGRHCVPMLRAGHSLETQLYQPCSRHSCRTCRFRIPTTNEESELYNHIDIRGKNNVRLDLSKFYNTCVPNLPHDLICPSCRQTNERTLVLSTMSYTSSSASARTLLTFTPADQEDESVTDNRPQRQVAANEFVFPPIQEDLAFPTKWEPLERDEESKHAIAIHCVSCQQFGVLSPVGPCLHPAFPCQQRTRSIQVGNHSSVVGGIFVRRRCAGRDCNGAVLCNACSAQSNHPAFQIEMDNQSTSETVTVQYINHCEVCKVAYCEDCAWIATVCHHW